MTSPVQPWPPSCQLWPVDPACLPQGWSEDPTTWPEEQRRAVMLASEYLWAATGRAYGMCLVTIRPCRTRRACPEPAGTPQGPLNPVLMDGRVINLVCGCAGDCGCGPLCEITLPGPVYSIARVRIDGQTVDPGTYRVDNGIKLVRQGGACWPECQNLAAPDGDPGTWSVTYWLGREIPALGRLAVTLLAEQFAKYCRKDKSCVLPERVTAVTRDGVSYTLKDAAGETNIKLVDDWVRLVNPAGLVEDMAVYSLDVLPHRTTTWPMDNQGGNPGNPSGPNGFTHIQTIPAQIWTIHHNLGFYPGGIRALDSASQEIRGRISYPSLNVVQIDFDDPATGVAHLS